MKQTGLGLLSVLALSVTTLTARSAFCDESTVTRDDAPNGDAAPQPVGDFDGWALEAAFGAVKTPGNSGALMLDRSPSQRTLSPRASIAVVRRLIPHLSLAIAGTTLASEDYESQWFDSTRTDAIHLRAQSLAVYMRVDTSLVPSHLSVFAQAGGGMGIGEISGPGAGKDAGIQTGALGGVFGGAVVAPWRHVAFVMQGGYESAQIFNFQGGYKPESGGLSFVLGIRLQGGDG